MIDGIAMIKNKNTLVAHLSTSNFKSVFTPGPYVTAHPVVRVFNIIYNPSH